MILDPDAPQVAYSPSEIVRLATRLEVALAAYRSVPAGGRSDCACFHVPGRLEVLGKHTDYAGGRGLVCAVERGFVVVAGPRADGDVVAIEASSGDAVRVSTDGRAGAGAAPWRPYVETVVRRLARNFGPALGGATIVFTSDLPVAAGLSSSSALVVSCTLGLFLVNGLAADERFRAEVHGAEAFATYASCVENGQGYGMLAGDAGVGTQGGSEDHVAMLCAERGHVSGYAFCPTRLERRVALPPLWTFVIGVSGVVAEKTGGARAAYNRAARDAARLVEIWNEGTERRDVTLGAALASSADALARLRELTDQADAGRGGAAGRSAPADHPLRPRLEQFVEESTALVPAVTEALAAGRFDALGPLVDRSQAAAERLLRNQVPETVALAADARELGAVAASAFGAGFGGSVWALVPATGADDFAARWQSSYRDRFPARAATALFFATRPGRAAARLACP